jgi:hypothetical protein
VSKLAGIEKPNLPGNSPAIPIGANKEDAINIEAYYKNKFSNKPSDKLSKLYIPPNLVDYNKKVEAYYINKSAYDDKKTIAQMGNRILICLIGIFLAYNLYFSISMAPPTDNSNIFEKINEWLDTLPTALFPLKCAITPVNILLKLLSIINKIMGWIPYQPLVFGFCLAMSYVFIDYGIARYFINMGMSVIDPMTAYGDTAAKTTGKFMTKHGTDAILALIVLLCVIGHALKACYDLKTPLVVSQPPALLLWLIVFGLSLLLLPVGKFVISLIVLYVCMGAMTQNGINIFQTMEDIDEKLTGPQVIYDCSDDDMLKQFLKGINKFMSNIMVENLYKLTIIPISLYNIIQSKSIANYNARLVSNFFSIILVTVVASNNESLILLYRSFMKNIYDIYS